MSKILKDTSNRIWKDVNGNILKSADFNQQVLQNGLSFWGVADANSMTLVSGKISELYDIRDTGKTGVTYGKMVQNTDTLRPIFQNNYMYSDALYPHSLSHSVNMSVKSLFLVMYRPIGDDRGMYLSDSGKTNFIGGANGNTSYRYFVNSSVAQYYFNNIKKNNIDTPNNNNIVVLHSITDFNTTTNMFLGTSLNIHNWKIYEFGWYNRVLSESEVVYNINALNAKYNIF